MTFEFVIICTIGLVIAWQFVLYMYIAEVKKQNEELEKTLDKLMDSLKKLAKDVSNSTQSVKELYEKNKSAAEGSTRAESKE